MIIPGTRHDHRRPVAISAPTSLEPRTPSHGGYFRSPGLAGVTSGSEWCHFRPTSGYERREKATSWRGWGLLSCCRGLVTLDSSTGAKRVCSTAYRLRVARKCRARRTYTYEYKESLNLSILERKFSVPDAKVRVHQKTVFFLEAIFLAA